MKFCLLQRETPSRGSSSFCSLLKTPKIFLFVLFTLFSSVLFAQNTIRGTVAAGDTALAGVTVQVKGTTTITQTDNEGRYSINAPANSTLVFTYVGYGNQEVKVGSRATVDIKMQVIGQQLNDVVVVGYGTQKRANITGAISNIKSEDIVRTPATTTSAALVGKVPGITARATDSRPGNGTNIQIRNLGSPLFVIDGVPYNANPETTAFGFTTGTGQDVFNNLGLEDIESISILKDASAAVYGLRASNGVVLVTTKKGSRSQPSINISGYYGLQNFTRYPQPANAGEFVLAKLQLAQNTGGNPALLYSKEELAKWQAGTEKGYKSYDYFKEVMRPNVPQSYISASASGGGPRSTYFMSVSNLNQEALIRDFTYNRTNLQANIESNLAKGLKIGTQISARLEKRHNVGLPGLDDFFNPFLSITSMWPTESPYANDNPLYINETHSVNLNPATYKDEVTGYVDEVWRAMNVNLNAQYDFGFGLTAKGIYSYNYMNEDFDGFEYTYNAYHYNPATDTYEKRTGNPNPWRERHKRNVISRFAQFQLSYNKQFGVHSISAVAAYERSDYDNSYYAVHTVPSNNYISLQQFSEQDYLADEWRTEARQGYIGRVNYNYKQRYLLEVLGRYDGSFLYAKGSRYGFFPGASLGWRISQEPFFDKIKGKVLTDLKFRASYGETGEELGVNAFDAIAGYTFNSGSSVFDGNYVIGTRPRGIPITNLSWVTDRTKNIGLDVTLLKGKITGQFDVFERRRIGLPAPKYDVLLPVEVGYSLPNENLNSDATRGVEGQIIYSDKAGPVDYSLGVNATVARLKILHTYKPRFENSWQQYRASVENRWERIEWGYHVIGQFQSQEQIDNYDVNNDGQANRTQLPGDLIYQDVNGDKIINFMDERPIGYARGAQPYMSFGINGNVAYKGFTLRFDFAGANMQSYNRYWELRYPFQNNGSSPAYMLTDVWHRADPYDNNSAWIPGKYPALGTIIRNGLGNDRNSDFWITNIRYIRLKNLELGYNLPKTFLKRFGISALRFYVNGTNLFSLDNVKEFEIDPEISAENGLVYPQQRLVNFGFNLSL